MRKYLMVLFMCICTSSCSYYHPAPVQDVRSYIGKDASQILIVNETSDSVQFIEGPLESLILGPYETYVMRLPWGYHYHQWREGVMYQNNIATFEDETLITDQTKRILIIPPLDDNVFRAVGTGTLKVMNY